MESAIRDPVHRPASTRPSLEDDTLGTALRRRLLTILACCVLGLIAGAVYLAIAPKKYVAASNILIEQAVPAGGAKNEALIEEQSEIVSSREVVLLADRNRELGNLPSLMSATDVVSMVKRNLHVEAAPRRNLLTVTYASENRDDAVKVVDRVVEAYRSYQSDERSRRAKQLSDVVRESRSKIDEDLHHAETALTDFDAQHGPLPAAEATTQRVNNLADALNRAELDTFAAKTKYDNAVADAGPALKGMDDKQLEETLQGSNSTTVADGGEAASQEVVALALQLGALRRTYADNHPSIVRATQRLGQMRLALVAGTRQRWQAAQGREAVLQETFDKTQRDSQAQSARAAERTRLSEDVARARGRADTIDRQLNDILLSTAAGALTIRVDSPAEINATDHPPLPRPAPTLATAAAIGLVFGGLCALAGEFRDAGSLRHVVPIRNAAPANDDIDAKLKLRVLATIPSADREDSDAPADLARAAHLDPFGPIANAVRSMRQAMEVEGQLAATILITAAADKQGTTTIASNLALTIARDNRRVLLVDLNFTSPSVAHLFGWDGTHGLAELIAGGEPLQLIRPTEVPRVDALPAGRPPVDSAAVLNSDAFASLLTLLSTAYDHVVIDAPPLARGDDARIVASMCDATVLVSKPTSASLRRAAGARDMLLMIGANLVGVALSRGDPTGEAPNPESGTGLGIKTDV